MNLALQFSRYLVDSPQFVTIDDARIEELAEQFAQEEMIIPEWNWPPYPELSGDDLASYHLLIETINFAFTDFYTGAKYGTEFQSKLHTGSMGMIAATSRALEDGFSLLDGAYLKGITRSEMEHIYRGVVSQESGFEEGKMPMMSERHDIFREVGNVLCERFGGAFSQVLREADGHLFGGGLVDLLAKHFPSFDDSYIVDGRHVPFNKRAQLAGGLLYARFLADGVELFDDVDQLTVFPDYQVPRALRDLGVIRYEESLAGKVDGRIIIPRGTREEIEIRAATIHAADRLIKRVNEIRDEPIHALHMDYKLWSEGRKNQNSVHHLTITTAY